MMRRERLPTLLESAHFLEQQPAHRDNSGVARAEAFASAVDHWPHALLHRLVLGREAMNTSHRRGSLLVAVDHVIIAGVANGPKRNGVHFRVNKCLVPDCIPLFRGKGCGGIPAHGPNPTCLVVSWGPAVAVNRKTLLIRDHGVGRKEKLRQSPVVRIVFRIAPYTDQQAVVFLPDGELRRPVEKMVFRPEIRAVLDLLQVSIRAAERIDTCVKKIGMAGVDAAFDGLQIVSLLKALGNVAVCFRDPRPLQFGKLRYGLAWTHVGPDDSAVFTRRISRRAHSVFECILRRFVWHIYTRAVHVVLPSVINSSQTTLLVASPKQACPPVR